MDLEAFVETSIMQIVRGICRAQLGCIDHVPTFRVGPATTEMDKGTVDLSFDIGIEVSDSDKSAGTIGVVIGSLGLGAKKESAQDNLATHRVTFSVPICIPHALYPNNQGYKEWRSKTEAGLSAPAEAPPEDSKL